jgi:hypothetical protein
LKTINQWQPLILVLKQQKNQCTQNWLLAWGLICRVFYQRPPFVRIHHCQLSFLPCRCVILLSVVLSN